MTKLELKSLAEYFGQFLPAGKIKDRETRLAVVLLYGSLAKPAKDVADEIETIRKTLTEGKDEELKKYAELMRKAGDKTLAEAEREAAKKEASGMADCVQIDKDFQEALAKVYGEAIEPDIKRIPLGLLYDGLADCGFPRFSPDMPISAVETIFKEVLQ